MAQLKLLVWNMEWMNDLFGRNEGPPEFRPDAEVPIHHPKATVRKRRDDLAGVLNELAPDVVIVVEGPNRQAELQLFFDTDVDGSWTTVVQPSKGQSQIIGAAVRTDRGDFANPPLTYTDTNNMEAEFGPFFVDTDDDEIQEQYKFERRPLLVRINPVDGRPFTVLGLHLKSKGIFDALEWSKWWTMADANRRKLLAQATQLRLRFLDPYLTAEQTRTVPLMVCGDINDGPGLDASEKRLFGSAIERLMGTVWQPDRCLRNALFDLLSAQDQQDLDFRSIFTTRFKDPIFNNVYHREWIDHVLYSANQPAPWVTQAQVHEKMADGTPIWRRFPHASDHYPVSVVVMT